MLPRPRAALIATSLLGALTACAGDAPAPRPLMAPLAEARSYGYSERSLPSGRIEVRYLGPARAVPTGGANRREHTERARAEAEDLALWRAAQVARLRGAAAFVVVDKRSDVEVEIRSSDYGYYGYPYAWYRRPHHGIHRYRPYGYGYPPLGGGFRDAYAQARVRLTIALLAKPRSGAFDAAKTAERLKRKYAGATHGAAY